MRLCLLSEPGVCGEEGDMASEPKVEARLLDAMEGERVASGLGTGGGAGRDKSFVLAVSTEERLARDESSSSDSSPSVGDIRVSAGGGGGTARPETSQSVILWFDHH